MPPSLSVALLGMGPRGLSVLERLLIRLRDEPPAGVVAFWAVDPVEHGSGRVWRTGQPAWLTTNATAAEVTVRSPDGFVSEPTFDDPSACPPRREYGEYLAGEFDELCAGARPASPSTPCGPRRRP